MAKRLLCLLLSTVLMLGLFPALSVSADSFDIEYEVKDNQVTITGYTGNATHLTIPDTIQDLPVTKIGIMAFKDCKTLQSVTLGTNVTIVTYFAFQACTNLKEIVIPVGIHKIDDSAFSAVALEDVFFGGTEDAWKSLGMYVPDTTYVHISCTDPVGHWVSDTKSATCTESGYSREACSCGYIRNEETMPSLGHEMSDWTTTKDATCTQTGERTKNCGRCDYHETEEISTIDHNYSSVVALPTCTERGYTTHTCACGERYMDSYVDAPGHSYVDGLCDICGDQDPDYIKPDKVIRLAGANRHETAFLIAEQMKEATGIHKFDAVIIANGYDFADALAGSYLSTVKNAPILLSWGKGGNYAYLDTNNIDYIKTNLKTGGTVYLLGGENAVPGFYENNLNSYNVKRLGGENRFETNLLILKEAGVKAGQEILVCTATEYADALSASATGLPILLVFNERGKLYGGQPDYLASLGGKNSFCIIGGENAVSRKLENALKAYGTVSRLAGSDRLDTSVMVAQKYFTDATSAVIAYGWNYPDGLCGGSLAYSMKAPLLLTYSVPAYYEITSRFTKSRGITSGVILGGEALISHDAVDAIF